MTSIVDKLGYVIAHLPQYEREKLSTDVLPPTLTPSDLV